jgi:Fe-S-cluster containining protein
MREGREVEGIYDCQACGACCLTYPDAVGYVRLSDADQDRLRGLELPIIEFVQDEGGGPEVIRKLGTRLDAEGRRTCAALDGSAGKACACRVYEQRPMACRMFEAGGLLCRLARQERGMS